MTILIGAGTVLGGAGGGGGGGGGAPTLVSGYGRVKAPIEQVLISVGVDRFIIPESADGRKITKFSCRVDSVGLVSGKSDIDLFNETKALAMLTSPATIPFNVNTGTDAVVNAANNTVNTGDIIRIDVTDECGTPASGLHYILTAT